MCQTNFVLALIAAAVLAGCGGSSGGDQTQKPKFSTQVSFGDSLSDVGSYAVGPVAALGGGKFTINGNNTSINPELTGKNWTELMAVEFGLSAPCAAQTGLDGGPTGSNVPVENHAGCFSYAQGGARVTNPVGPGNKLTGVTRGDLTVPLVIQIQNHLNAVGGKFKGDEVVFVMAGANDALIQLASLSTGADVAGAATFASTLVGLLAAGADDPATAAQAIRLALETENARPGHTDETVVGAAVFAAAVQPGNSAVASPAVFDPMVINAQAAASAAGAAHVAANGPNAVAAMVTAGAELAALVKTQIIGKGANNVVLNNLPDIATTPSGLSQSAETQQLIVAMTKAFNDQLSAGLASEVKVLLVDVFSVSHDQAINPGLHGLTNVKEPACDLSPAKNSLGNSLGCNATNLTPGDVSHYAFADTVHPTPFNYLLLARHVSKNMVIKGWL